MKRTFAITAERNGKLACIHIETEADWTPLRIGDDVSEFIPDTISQIDVADDNGSRAIKVQTTNCDGIDVRRRR